MSEAASKSKTSPSITAGALFEIAVNSDRAGFRDVVMVVGMREAIYHDVRIGLTDKLSDRIITMRRANTCRNKFVLTWEVSERYVCYATARGDWACIMENSW